MEYFWYIIAALGAGVGTGLAGLSAELLRTLAVLVVFPIVAVGLALLCFWRFHVGGEARRKVLHTIAFLILLVVILAADHWYVPAVVFLLFAAVVYPVLRLFEGRPTYSSLFQERSGGEVRKSLVLLFGSTAVLVALYWGALGSEQTVVAAILAWGLGDITAALVGKRNGSHKLRLLLADPNKSREGSGAMYGAAFVAAFLVLLLWGTEGTKALTAALLGAVAATCTEAVTRNGYDTVTTPWAAAVVIWAACI